MASYNPPKQSSTGGIISGAGDVLMAGGALAATTIIGAPVGLAVAGVGALAKVAGSLVESKNKLSLNEYNNRYNAIASGEQNIDANAKNNINSYKSNFISNGVNSSIKNINTMLEPTSSVSKSAGTSLNDNKLV